MKRPSRFIPFALVAVVAGLGLTTGPVAATNSGSSEGAVAPAASSGTHSGSGQDNLYSAIDDGVPNVPNPGKYLFEQGCSTCHGIDGAGTKQAPSLIGVGAAAADFYLSTGRMPLNQPLVQAPRKQPKYSDQQIAAITKYVASLGEGPAIPNVDPSKGNLVEGEQLYANNCAACHNSQGSGGALGRDYYAPRLFSATPTQLGEAMRVGPGAMPVFGTGQLSDQQVDSIVKYIVHLRDHNQHGGLALGRVGPVTEGFVAWILGLGLLLGVTRWIGTRV